MSLFKTSMMVAVAMVYSSVASAQAPILFNFDSTEAVESLSGQIGAGLTVDGITLSTLAEGPEFAASQPTGEIISLQTNINDVVVTNAGLGIDNQTISDGEFEMLFGDNNEDAFISFNESLTISFDAAVVVTSIDFFGIAGGEVVTVIVDGFDPFEFSNGPNDIFANPFGAVTIPAGTDISFSLTASDAGDDNRFVFTNIEVVAAGSVLLGDANCDNVVDFIDIGPFVTLLATQGFKAQADIDGNGMVNFLDIGPFVAILTNSGS